MVPEAFVSEVGAVIESKDLSALAILTSTGKRIKKYKARNLPILMLSTEPILPTETTEPTEATLPTEPPALIRFEFDDSPRVLWSGFIGVISTVSNDFTAISLLTDSPTNNSALTEKLGPEGSLLQFELVPTYSLVERVPTEANWFTIAKYSDSTPCNSLATHALELMSKQVIGSCLSAAGHVILLFSAGLDRMVIAVAD